jgi:hypothetical protein
VRERGGDKDRVIRRAGRVSLSPVTGDDQGVADALGPQAAAGLRGDVGPDLDADHVRGQPGQQRGLVPIAGSDLQYLLPPRRPSPAIITAGSGGWVVTWPCGIGSGRSAYACAAYPAGTKAARGVAPIAASTRSSVTPARRAAKMRSAGEFPRSGRATGPGSRWLGGQETGPLSGKPGEGSRVLPSPAG